ncbi:MAG: hypothetical protein IKD77_01945 [Bacilli bacterium]|nr:hypothetical protein [Bacilli bacterium]
MERFDYDKILIGLEEIYNHMKSDKMNNMHLKDIVKWKSTTYSILTYIELIKKNIEDNKTICEDEKKELSIVLMGYHVKFVMLQSGE